ncbi:hypothetical protein AAG906_020901 [Vitis piasezkii]
MRNSMSVERDTWKPSMLVLTSFDTWLLVSYFYDGMSSSMKQLLKTMCGGDFMREVRKTKSQPNAFNAKEMFGNQENSLDNSSPTTMFHMEIPTTQIGGTIQISPKPREPQDTQPGQASQQASNLEQAIVNLSKVVGDFVGDRNPSMLNSVKELTV